MFGRTATIFDWEADRELLVERPYGVIETAGGRVAAVHLRLFPKLVAWPDLWPTGPAYHARGKSDRCLLYYNQPRRFRNFMALKYVVSTMGTSLATFRAALVALDRLAALKQTDALLCDVANARISDRLLRRWGWAAHKPQRWRRNFIKRFYGVYPCGEASTAWAAGEPALC